MKNNDQQLAEIVESAANSENNSTFYSILVFILFVLFASVTFMYLSKIEHLQNINKTISDQCNQLQQNYKQIVPIDNISLVRDSTFILRETLVYMRDSVVLIHMDRTNTTDQQVPDIEYPAKPGAANMPEPVPNNVSNYRDRMYIRDTVFRGLEATSSDQGTASDTYKPTDIEIGQHYWPDHVPCRDSFVDLVLVEVAHPQWSKDLDATLLSVKVRNNGPNRVDTFSVYVRDFDFSYYRTFDWYRYYLGSRNFESLLENYRILSTEIGDSDDPEFMKLVMIDSLGSKEEKTITIQVPQLSLFNPNCELLFILDAENRFCESDELNNILLYIAEGHQTY